LLLLELGKAGSTGAPLQDIAASIGQSKPTLLRGINALIDHGFVEQVARGRYRLGPSIFALARVESAVALDVANWHPVLEKLAGSFGQTFYLVRRAGFDVVVVDKCMGGAPIQAFTQIGERLPAGVGSGSLAILATLEAADRDAILSANASRLSRWNTEPSYISELVKKATVSGHVSDMDLFVPGCGGVGVPIHERGRYIATMSITMSAPLQFFENHKVLDVAEEMKRVIADNLRGYTQSLR
jgi:DNA-binding IclR family transcriptional regulator